MVVEYTYDAWGRLLSTEGTEKLDIGLYNPLRYRGYVYDRETGLYYLQSRYYNPERGRFINADCIIGAGDSLVSYNMFAYCGNNPVMGYDPMGTFDWASLGQGATWLTIGITAVCVGVSVLTCGVAAPAMMAVAAVTVAAGTLTAINGVSEIGEAATGHNFIRDDVFGGNEAAYTTYANITSSIAQIGSAICGGWISKNSPRINAYKSMGDYNVKLKHLPTGKGKWSKFNTTSQSELQQLGKEVLKNTPMSSLSPNSADTYIAVYDFGKVIGTGGQTAARLVFSIMGQIITFFPVA